MRYRRKRDEVRRVVEGVEERSCAKCGVGEDGIRIWVALEEFGTQTVCRKCTAEYNRLRNKRSTKPKKLAEKSFAKRPVHGISRTTGCAFVIPNKVPRGELFTDRVLPPTIFDRTQLERFAAERGYKVGSSAERLEGKRTQSGRKPDFQETQDGQSEDAVQ